MMEDSARSQLFEQTLTRLELKWYIELPRASNNFFFSLETVFLIYENMIEILMCLQQNMSTHIYNNINESRRHRIMISVEIPYQLLKDWFVNSLLPNIAKDVAFSSVVIEEKVVLKVQQLDLGYYQSRMLYEIIPNTPRSRIEKSMLSLCVDSVTRTIGDISVSYS